MLLRLEIENFYSIRRPQLLDFTVARTAPADDRFVSFGAKGALRVPKVAAFFGPNASGKTTALRAVSFMRSFASSSFQDYQPDESIVVYPFDNASGRSSPTKLAMEFIPFRIDSERDLVIRYELWINHRKSTNFVSRETLSSRTIGTKWKTVFKREGKINGSTIYASKSFNLDEDDPRRQVRNNVSLISSLLQFDHKHAKRFSDFMKYPFVSNIAISRVRFPESFVSEYLEKHPDALEHLNRLIRIIDVGIERVTLKRIDGSLTPMFKHSGLDSLKTLSFESQGTQNFYCLFPNLTYSLTAGASAILDEIDSDLHPALLLEIVRWFRSTRDNGFSSQLIMSCQNSSLLSDLWKEEVFLVEKTDEGETTIGRLADLPNLRRDTNLYSKYMAGEFGALPQFG
jgi:AAA15 family ATPase/GTPase